MDWLIGGGIVLLLFALGRSMADRVRSRGARRRHQELMPTLAGVAVPVRLRGVGLEYPGFWRAGRIDLSTGRWQPRSRWGVPVSLAASRVERAYLWPAGLPFFPSTGKVLNCVDRRGGLFQLAAFDTDDARMVADCLLSALVPPTEPFGPAPHPPSRVVRNLVPLTSLVLVLLGVVLAGFGVPTLLGARTVDAAVVSNPGGGYPCEVVWPDSNGGTGWHDHADCGSALPGDHLSVHLLGWPLSGAVADPAAVLVVLVTTISSAFVIAVMMVRAGLSQRRRVAGTVVLGDVDWIG